MAVKSVQDLLIDELRDIYHAEQQLVKALPKMAKAATSDKLRQAFEHHLQETNGHVERLDQVFEKLDTRARGKRCEAMQGLIEEAKELMDEIKTPEVLDVGADHRRAEGRALRDLGLRHGLRARRGARPEGGRAAARQDPRRGEAGRPEAQSDRAVRGQSEGAQSRRLRDAPEVPDERAGDALAGSLLPLAPLTSRGSGEALLSERRPKPIFCLATAGP